MKLFDQIIGNQASKVRKDIEVLGHRFTKMTHAIEKNFSDEVRISRVLRQISHDQSRFNDRVDTIRRRLHTTKTSLAFRHS